MYHIVICDDEESDRKILKEYLLESGFAEDEVFFQEFPSAKELLLHSSENSDAVFLDICMEGMDGKEAALALRNWNDRVLLVFFTALTALTYEICKAAPFRYIEKGFRRDKMIEELKEVVKEIKRRKNPPMMTVRFQGKSRIVLLKDILYIEKGRNKCTVHGNGDIKICSFMDRLENVEKRVSRYGFGKPHNSYLVNIAHISRYENDEIILDNGEILHIARSKKESFKKTYIDEICRKG